MDVILNEENSLSNYSIYFNENKNKFNLTFKYSKSYYESFKCYNCKFFGNKSSLCPNCDSLYCEFCLKDKMYYHSEINSYNCLNCGLNFSPIEIINQPFLNLLNAIEIKCPFQPDCEIEIEIGLLEEHLKSCEFLKLFYTCKFCFQEFTVKKNQSIILENHLNICEDRELKCLDCENIYIKKNSVSHFEECKSRKINCTYCNQIIMFKDISDHYLTEACQINLKNRILLLENERNVHQFYYFNNLFSNNKLLISNNECNFDITSKIGNDNNNNIDFENKVILFAFLTFLFFSR